MNASSCAARMSRSLLARLAVVMMVATGLTGLSSLTAQPAQAAVSAATGSRAVHVAATRKGAPYVWGAVGPRRFDCSGLTKWVYGRVGKKLPRTAAQQYAATTHVSARSRRAGDLVFFKSGGYVYHVGIYAGAGRIWHAPKPGDRVKLATLWTSAVSYGRVR
jgi:cell wall-associated NlpC family hydrolase